MTYLIVLCPRPRFTGPGHGVAGDGLGGEVSSFLSEWPIVQLVLICLILYRQRHDSYESDSGSDSSSDSDRGRRTLKSAVTTKVGQPHLLP